MRLAKERLSHEETRIIHTRIHLPANTDVWQKAMTYRIRKNPARSYPWEVSCSTHGTIYRCPSYITATASMDLHEYTNHNKTPWSSLEKKGGMVKIPTPSELVDSGYTTLGEITTKGRKKLWGYTKNGEVRLIEGPV